MLQFTLIHNDCSLFIPFTTSLLMATLQYQKFIHPGKNEQDDQNNKAHVFGQHHISLMWCWFGSYRKLLNSQLLQRNGASCIRRLHYNFISTTYGTGKAMWHQEIKRWSVIHQCQQSQWLMFWNVSIHLVNKIQHCFIYKYVWNNYFIYEKYWLDLNSDSNLIGCKIVWTQYSAWNHPQYCCQNWAVRHVKCKYSHKNMSSQYPGENRENIYSFWQKNKNNTFEGPDNFPSHTWITHAWPCGIHIW